MPDINNNPHVPYQKPRVLEYPVQEYGRREVSELLLCIMSRSLNRFIEDTFENKDGLYDKIVSDEEVKNERG